MKARAIISWILFVALALGVWFGLPLWLGRPKEQGLSGPLRKGLESNEKVVRYLPFPKVVEYAKEMAVKKVRVNGKVGLKTALDTAAWCMKVHTPNQADTLVFDLRKVQALPKTEVVFDFKCIEGWNQITWWGGCSFALFVKHYFPQLLTAGGELKYAWVGLATPDKSYYVGIDAESMMHPKTLLCYELNGTQLPLDQGYPLRLIIPVKYGIKHLKRIGYLTFSNTRPKDYWAERGYDYHAGH